MVSEPDYSQAFQDGLVVEYADNDQGDEPETLTLHLHPLGELVVTSGQIVACDPLASAYPGIMQPWCSSVSVLIRHLFPRLGSYDEHDEIVEQRFSNALRTVQSRSWMFTTTLKMWVSGALQFMGVHW